MKDILSTLQEFGLTLLEAKLFLLLTELGSSPVSALARKAGVKRTNLYNILEKLSQKGLVTEYERSNVKYFQAIEPKKLIDLQEQEKRNIESNIKNLQEIIPSLEAVKNPMAAPPRVQYFQGEVGLGKLLDQILSNESFDAYFNPEIAYNAYPKVVSHFLESGNQKQLPIREIMTNTQGNQEYIKKINNINHQYKLLARGRTLYSDTIIYGNKVSFLSYTGHSFGVVIESEDIVQSQKLAFEIMWESLS